MKFRRFTRPFAALALVCALCAVALADVIRMKDGQVIRGQIIGFRDQQFTVLIGSGTGGRRSRITLYMEDVDSIEFDSAAGLGTGGTDAADSRTQPPARNTPQQRPSLGNEPGGLGTSAPSNNPPRSAPAGNTGAPASGQPAGGESPFFPVRVRVRADNTANGWTDSGLVLRRGQRLRITASGRVSLGQGRFSTPTGLPRVLDSEKLMRNEPTGALIAVVGDDNDDFIFVGAGRELFAPRDGRLFLGVNEGNLNDNTGTYDVQIEVEPVSGGRD
ncbi:MAG TPA: hypothetical protein VEY09_05770 [Pyrinomonadaceae bacterium]|nr:hypothetical protein [Pyrinomonadaceae bacterium]